MLTRRIYQIASGCPAALSGAIGCVCIMASLAQAAPPAGQQQPSQEAATKVLGWTDSKTIQLKDLRVTLSEPVLVKRSRWYCWFPSLMRQPNGVLWSIMSPCADVQVSDAINYVSRSKDGGLTWDEPRVIGDAGLGHLILPDGSAMVIPFNLRPRASGTIGAPCNILSPQGQLSMRNSGANVSGWPKPLKSQGPDLATASFVFNGGKGAYGRQNEYLATLYGHFEGDARYSLVLAESSDGFDWRIRSIIAGADCPLEGAEGPCEASVCRLKDGRLMCIFRSASFVALGRTMSADDGRTWTKPTAIEARSVEPSLAVLPQGVVALSSGRPGIFVWFNADGQGTHWQPVDVVAQHNACRPQDSINPDSSKAWLSRDQMIRQGLHGFTTAYTDLLPLDDRHLLLTYDRVGLGWHPIPDESDETNSVWVVRIRVEK